jgi:hypothetical protein
MKEWQRIKLEIAKRYARQIDDIVADARDAQNETDRLAYFTNTFWFDEAEFSFLDLIICDAANKEKKLAEGDVEYFLTQGVNSDFLDENQKRFAELARLNVSLENLQVSATEFQKCLNGLLKKPQFKNRHDFDNLLKHIIQKGFSPNEQDIELLDKLKEKVHQTYSDEESQIKNGEYKFNHRVRHCFDTIYQLVLTKLPDQTVPSIAQAATSSSPSPLSVSPLAEQKGNFLE